MCPPVEAVCYASALVARGMSASAQYGSHVGNDPPEPGGDGHPLHRAIIFMVVAFALMMTSIDATIVATALHAMQRELGASINWLGWTITAYAFGLVLMLPISSKLSEQYGHRKVFLGSVATFTVASLLCGFADNVYMLIVLRAVQAAGAAGFTPSATGIIVDHFGDERDRAVSYFGSIFPAGAMVGPIFGGLFVTYWTWRGIFWVNVPFGIAVIVLSIIYVPQDLPRPVEDDDKKDTIGTMLLGIGLLAGMFAISYLGEKGVRVWSTEFLAPLATAIIALWAFFRHIRRSAHPFIAPNLITGTGFGAVNLINVLYGGVVSGSVVLIPLYAADRYGIGALGASTLLIAQGGAAVLLSAAAAIVIRRTGYRLPIYIGGTICAAGIVLLALGPVASISSYAWLAGSAFLVGVGGGTLDPASRNAGLQLEPEHSATLAALRTGGTQIGSIATVAAATAILASSADPGNAQSWVYAAVALLLFCTLPLIAHIPEHHGSW